MEIINMQEIDKKAIGARIKSFREQNKIDQATLAKEAGMNVKTISLVENGHRAPTQKLLTAISIKYHADLDWISSGKDDPTNTNKANPKSLPNLHAKVIIIEKELSELKTMMQSIIDKLS